MLELVATMPSSPLGALVTLAIVSRLFRLISCGSRARRDAAIATFIYTARDGEHSNAGASSAQGCGVTIIPVVASPDAPVVVVVPRVLPQSFSTAYIEE